MIVRMSTWSGTPDALERWTKAVTERVKPMVQGLRGNVGAYFLIDREHGEAITITVWENEETAKATDIGADESRSKTIDSAGVTLVKKGRYEVVARI